MRSVIMIFGLLMFVGSMFFGFYTLMSVKTDVGLICSVLVLQCAWILVILLGIYQNTASAKKDDAFFNSLPGRGCDDAKKKSTKD
jgi:hypothetical protein